MTADPGAFARACFAGFAASVAPLVGVELSVSEPELGPETAPPDGELSVLPVSLTRDGAPAAVVTLHSPTAALATLGRRMHGDPEPDKERDLSKEDLDAVGKLLNLWVGALDASARAHLDSGARCSAQPWWRTGDAKGNAFPAGPHFAARCKLAVPGGTAVPVCLRLSETLAASLAASAAARAGIVLLLGFDDASREPLAKLLAAAKLEVRADALELCRNGEALRGAHAVLLAADADGALEACRQLRLGNASWRIPAVACLREPTRERVLSALAHGASHVLRIPADEAALLRVLKDARP